MINICPICDTPDLKHPQISLNFREDSLPKRYETYFCDKCLFGFSRPLELNQTVLDNYYSENINDHLAESKNIARFEKQLSIIGKMIDLESVNSVLDFGCGNGDLLTLIAKRLDIHRDKLVGIDLTKKDLQERRNSFNLYPKLHDVQNMSFDLIIVSHTLEHLLDFNVISHLKSLLSENGYMYIEVPNSQKYHKYSRGTPFYYFDRLHVNHFSMKSLSLVLEQYDLQPIECIQYAFNYEDGFLYPALAIVASRFQNSLSQSLESDSLKLASIAVGLQNMEIIVWGLGDNFLRLESLGFFDSLKVVGLVDRAYTGHKSFRNIEVTHLNDAIVSNPRAILLITINWGRDKLLNLIRGVAPDQIVEFI